MQSPAVLLQRSRIASPSLTDSGGACPKADSLNDCRKMLALAKAGKTNGYLLEGMACPGGCVGGPGTLMPIPKAGQAVNQFASQSPYQHHLPMSQSCLAPAPADASDLTPCHRTITVWKIGNGHMGFSPRGPYAEHAAG